MTQRKLGSFDRETGEIVEDGVLVFVPKKQLHPYGDRWMMLHQDKSQEIALDKELDGTDLRVYMYLFGMLDYQNFIHVSQAEIADNLGLRKPHLNRSVRKLVSKGVLIEGPRVQRSKTYRLNSHYGYKGKIKKLSSAMQRDTKHLQLISDNSRCSKTGDLF